jgi:hypothetical protein
MPRVPPPQLEHRHHFHVIALAGIGAALRFCESCGASWRLIVRRLEDGRDVASWEAISEP